MVNREDREISMRQQSELLSLNRSTLYYRPAPVSEYDLRLINRTDELFTEHPYFGSRRLMEYLNLEGYDVGRDKVRSVMRVLGLEAIYPKRGTSIRNQAHVIYPYLLRGVEIVRVDQVWSADITYIRLSRGFVYLVVVMDWYSRYVLSWRLSNTLDSDFCVEVLRGALKYGVPEIFNTDQGSQFTSEVFTGLLIQAGIQISMDGKGRAMDNVFVERLWRSVKYENVYLNSYGTIPEAEFGLGSYFEFYNNDRLHQALNYQTPAKIYAGGSGKTPTTGVYETGGEVSKWPILGVPQPLAERRSLNLEQMWRPKLNASGCFLKNCLHVTNKEEWGGRKKEIYGGYFTP